MASDSPTTTTLTTIFLCLLGLLALTVVAAFIDLNRVVPGHFAGMAVALTIAVAKAVLIVLCFMHVKYSPHRIAVFAGAGFVWLTILLTLTLSDYLTRNASAGPSPKGEPHFLAVPSARP